MNLVLLDAKTIGEVPNLFLLNKFGDLRYHQTTRPEQTLSRVQNADIIITNKVVIDGATIEKSPMLKLICIAATGTNNVDKIAAAERGVVVKNVSDYSTNSVAQVTFSLILHLLHSIPYFDKYVKEGDYSKSDIFTHLGKSFWEISGKRFGIIGLGNIGKKVAEIATAFGAEVFYYSTSGQNKNQQYRQLELNELLKTSDIVSIHAPLNEYTANLINYSSLLLMKKTALLINAGRGGIVNEADLVRALNEDVIAGAGIDVFETEPINVANPLLQVNNKEKLVLTPHVAWASIEARTLLMEKVGRNIDDFLKEHKQ